MNSCESTVMPYSLSSCCVALPSRWRGGCAAQRLFSAHRDSRLLRDPNEPHRRSAIVLSPATTVMYAGTHAQATKRRWAWLQIRYSLRCRRAHHRHVSGRVMRVLYQPGTSACLNRRPARTKVRKYGSITAACGRCKSVVASCGRVVCRLRPGRRAAGDSLVS